MAAIIVAYLHICLFSSKPQDTTAVFQGPSCFLSPHGMRRHRLLFLSVTSVGHAFNEIKETWLDHCTSLHCSSICRAVSQVSFYSLRCPMITYRCQATSAPHRAVVPCDNTAFLCYISHYCMTYFRRLSLTI